MQEAIDFLEESRALHALIAEVGRERLHEATQFKGWTLRDVLQHLHVWNEMACLQIEDESLLMTRLGQLMSNGGDLRRFERELRKDSQADALLSDWRAGFERTAERFAKVDPKARLQWAGPAMSARSSITARLMETWAHGQEIYDHLGVERQNTDRIRGIVVLGVNTFAWTYKARGAEPPGQLPRVELVSPTGDHWVFGEASKTNKISGAAEAFCQVVTQTRNIADTDLVVSGSVANDWMSKAQCFAGPPSVPPAPGTRFRGKPAAI
ncbi:MAG: TIGR03084 family metal-binding protein [Pseudomonadota bacterium]